MDIQLRRCLRTSCLKPDSPFITVYLLSSFLTIEIWRAEAFANKWLCGFSQNRAPHPRSHLARSFKDLADLALTFLFFPKQPPVTASQEHVLIPTGGKGLSR